MNPLYKPETEKDFCINDRLSIYLGKSVFGGDVRLDALVIGNYLLGPLSLGLHKEGTYDHVGQPIVWLGEHDEKSQSEIYKIVEFPVEQIHKYLHLFGLR